MENRGVWLILIVFVFGILIIGFVFAQDVDGDEESDSDENGNEENINDGSGIDLTANVEKAYQCLRDSVDSKERNSLSLEEAVFSILALGGDNKLEKIIDDKKGAEDCWPRGSCSIKETSQVLLAFDRIGKNTKKIEDWLLSKEQTAKDLTWFLEIDVVSHEASECTISYDSDSKTLKILENMKIQGNVGSCLSIGYGGYWLKIKDTCLEKEFEVSCEKDFVTALAYQKGTSGTIFISSETHSSASLGTTNEKVKSKCFGSGNNCDYEGTLWAALILDKTGNDVSAYFPYLLALADNNVQLFPSAFLYVLAKGEDQYNEIISKQKSGQFWDLVGSPYNRFYDTSLALLSLTGTNAEEMNSAQEYLLNIQTGKGCWNNNNIRDTAFILYSGWSRSVNRGGVSVESCESAGYSCENSFSCTDSGGDILNEYDCSNFGGLQVCCSIGVQKETCNQKNGVICSANQECDGISESSSEGSCCLGVCALKQIENICESVGGGNCRGFCDSNEKETGDNCPLAGDKCCVFENNKDEEGSTLWIWILIILIILVVMGIIFRNKLKMWWWRWRGKVKTNRITRGPSGPGNRPGPSFRRGPPPGFKGSNLGSPRKAVSPADKEMEETMRKLKEMSK